MCAEVGRVPLVDFCYYIPCGSAKKAIVSSIWAINLFFVQKDGLSRSETEALQNSGVKGERQQPQKLKAFKYHVVVELLEKN